MIIKILKIMKFIISFLKSLYLNTAIIREVTKFSDIKQKTITKHFVFKSKCLFLTNAENY